MKANTQILPKQFVLMIFICAALMFGLSYLWHGVLLNDYENVRIPMQLYFGLSALVYLVISLALNLLYRYTALGASKYRGVLLGMALGFFIYLIAFVLGVSFSQHSAQHVSVDFIWQMIEQGIGGAALGLLYQLAAEVRKVKAMKSQ